MAELVNTTIKTAGNQGRPHTNAHLVSRIYEMPEMKMQNAKCKMTPRWIQS